MNSDLNNMIPDDWKHNHRRLSGTIPAVQYDSDGIVSFTQGPQAEYDALTKVTGLVGLPLVASILIEGEDAMDYMHRRLSQSIKDLDPGKGVHALQLDAVGRVQADMLVYSGNRELILLVDTDYVEATADMAEKYVLMDNVEVIRQWTSEMSIGLAGPESTRIINSLIEPDPPGGPLSAENYDAVFTVNLAGIPCRIFGDGRWDMPFFHISVPVMCFKDLVEELADCVNRCGGCTVGKPALELARIESGIPLYGRELDESTNALDACLYDAVSFDKGCYPGQEVMARINNLGHPARCLVRLELDVESDPGPAVLHAPDGRQAGRLSSSCTWQGLGRTAALGYLGWEFRDLGLVEIGDGTSSIKANVIRLKTDPES